MNPRPKGGRPLLVHGKESIRVGFVITKEQWLNLTAKARRDGCSFSDVVRQALDHMEWCEAETPEEGQSDPKKESSIWW